MKKVLTILLISLANSLVSNSSAQNVSRNTSLSEKNNPVVNQHKTIQLSKPLFSPLLFESFENDFPPNNWLTTSYGNANEEWRLSSSRSHSGSNSAFIRFCSDTETMDEWLITPAVDLSQAPAAKLIFFEEALYWGDWGDHHYIKISTTSQNDKFSFKTLLDMTPSNHTINGFLGAPVEIDLTNYLGKSTVYIAFQYTGTYADNWYIDDVGVYQPDEHDVRVKVTNLENHYTSSTTIQPTATVENVGLNTETFEVSFGYYDWYSIPVTLDTKTVANLPVDQTEQVIFNNYTFAENIQYTYFVQTHLQSDMDNSNDKIIKDINTFTKNKTNVLVEIGTGTWCGFCPGSALAIDRLYHEYPENLSVLEYHFGDSYANDMSSHRIDMYRITGYPTAIFDGTEKSVGGTAADGNWTNVYTNYKNIFASQQNSKTGFSLELSLFVDGADFTATTKTTYEALSLLKTYRLFFALNESHIAELWKGLDSLQFVAREMFHDYSGIPLYEGSSAPSKGLYLSHSVNFNAPSGVIKNNCQLIAFIQNMDSKEIVAVQKVDLSQAKTKTQNFEVVLGDTAMDGNTGDEIALGGIIINNTNAPMEIVITRTSNAIPQDWTSALCLTICSPPWMDTISGTIPAQDTIEFSIHFFTSSEPGEGEAVLNFQDQARTASFTHSFKARTNPTSVPSSGTANYSFQLLGNYPNPFNSSTNIRFETAERTAAMHFKVYSLLGQLVYEQEFKNLPAGSNQIHYDGKDLLGKKTPSGIYIYRLSFNTTSGEQKSFLGRFINLK